MAEQFIRANLALVGGCC